MKKLFLFFSFSIFLMVSAQDPLAKADTSWKKEYQATAERINNLVHTKVDARFDFQKAYMYGKVWITLTPHFYPTDSLKLDAKGMEIKELALVKSGKKLPLKYTYDGMELDINLDRTYTRGEKYQVYIDYISKPDEYKGKGSAAISDAKGLYFINPRGEEKNKPTQIWTQGETEATSVWCPTIDKPNQRTTQELSMTVPSKFVTLSNGKLVSQKKNSDGTRTDSWKMDLPHAPYLFFMGAGEFSIVKDSYKGKEVSYYVEKEYAPVARKIFGNTPEMMGYFSKILGIEYPWNKYAQLVGRDYVSGAMENTTAVIHQQTAQQDARELVDGNVWEGTIAHELFHHWFGNLVTTESWGNLTLNESFANYSETLWEQYKYGKDAGDDQNYKDMQGYLLSQSNHKDLVRFYYSDKEDMFDAVSYNKGGRILHMLRNYVGDSAFFKSLNLFLTNNRFKAAESHQLRLAFEEVTGKDLNWFWNQWYFGAGHPKLTIDYVYDDQGKNVKMVVKQSQPEQIFRLPVAIDIYNGSKKTRYNRWISKPVDTLYFNYETRPDLINFDGDKILLAEKNDNKSLENYLYQYEHAGLYLDRREAIDAAAKAPENLAASRLLISALNDKFSGLRLHALSKLDMNNPGLREKADPVIAKLASTENNALVKSEAISLLGTYADEKYKPIFEKGVSDSSYSVAGSSLEALAQVDSSSALSLARQLMKHPANGKLAEAIATVLIMAGDESGFDLMANRFGGLALSDAKVNLLVPFIQTIVQVKDTEKVKRGIDLIVEFRNQIPEQYGWTPAINEMMKNIIKAKERAVGSGLNAEEFREQSDYINQKINSERKAF